MHRPPPPEPGSLWSGDGHFPLHDMPSSPPLGKIDVLFSSLATPHHGLALWRNRADMPRLMYLRRSGEAWQVSGHDDSPPRDAEVRRCSVEDNATLTIRVRLHGPRRRICNWQLRRIPPLHPLAEEDAALGMLLSVSPWRVEGLIRAAIRTGRHPVLVLHSTHGTGASGRLMAISYLLHYGTRFRVLPIVESWSSIFGSFAAIRCREREWRFRVAQIMRVVPCILLIGRDPTSGLDEEHRMVIDLGCQERCLWMNLDGNLVHRLNGANTWPLGQLPTAIRNVISGGSQMPNDIETRDAAVFGAAVHAHLRTPVPHDPIP